MASQYFGLDVGDGEFSIQEDSSTNSTVVELVVNLATTTVNESGSTRAITKQEVLDCLEKLENHIIKSNWPPA
jgi:hypothetical protein